MRLRALKNRHFAAIYVLCFVCWSVGAEEPAIDWATLSKRLDSRPRAAAVQLPAIRLALLPFRSDTGKSNAEWFGNSVPAFLKKPLEEAYVFQEIKIPENDALLESLPKRNLSAAERLMFTAAYLSADAIILGTFTDVPGKDAVIITPKVYFTHSREIIALESFEVPISADLGKVSADVAEKAGKILEDFAGSRGNPPANNKGKKKISFAVVPKVYWMPAEIFPKAAGRDPQPDSVKLAYNAVRYARSLVRARYAIIKNDRAKGSAFVVKHQIHFPTATAPGYRVAAEISGSEHMRRTTVSASAADLVDAMEASSRELLKVLKTVRVPVSGKVYGLKEPGAALELNGSETVPVEGLESQFVFSKRVAPGREYRIGVKDQIAAARDCHVYSGAQTAAFSKVDEPYVFCASRTYPIAVNLSGLLYDFIDVSLNGKEVMPMRENGKSAFELYVDDRAEFRVEITRQPAEKGHTCLIKKNGVGRLAGKSPEAVEVRCTMEIQHEIYTAAGMPLFLQPGGRAVLRPDGNFPYNRLGTSVTGTLGYRNRYLLPWRMVSGAEAAYTFGSGRADILSAGGKVYFENERFSYSLLEFYAYGGYKFHFGEQFALITAAGFTYGLHDAVYDGQSLYRRQLPGATVSAYLQYKVSQSWFLESAVKTTYYLTDINFFVVSCAVAAGVRL